VSIVNASQGAAEQPEDSIDRYAQPGSTLLQRVHLSSAEWKPSVPATRY